MEATRGSVHPSSKEYLGDGYSSGQSEFLMGCELRTPTSHAEKL